jgi:hypothetical protein
MVRCQLKHNSFWIWQLKKLEQYVLWCPGREYCKVIDCNVGQVAVKCHFMSRMSSALEDAQKNVEFC